MATDFSDVHFEVEHVPETHRIEGVHGSGETQELPGFVNVYLVIDGGRLLFTSYKAGKVFDAIDQGRERQASQQQQDAQAQSERQDVPPPPPPTTG